MADVDALIQNLKSGDYYSRSTAARSLGEVGGEKAAAALIEALGDEDDWVQEYAAEALGKLRSQSAVTPLGELLESSSYKVRTAAVDALGKIGGDEARSLLETLRDDPDSWVRTAALNALASLPEATSPAPVKEPPATPKPAPAPDETAPGLEIEEDLAEPMQAAPAPTPRLADQVPRTPEEIVEEIASGTDTKYRATRSGFLLRVPVGGGRNQKVRLSFNSADEEGSPIIQIFTVIGPARQEHYRWALKLNPSFSYGALGLVRIDGKEVLAIMNTLLEENVDIKALEKSIRTLARKGDELEKKLIKKDLW